MENMEIYLQPTKFFDFNKSKVKQKALEITESCGSDNDKAKALFYWVRDNVIYNMRLFIPIIPNNFKASKVMLKRQGFCVSKSILLSTLARAVEIPARIHLVDLINHLVSQKVVDFMGTNVMFYHGFSEFHLDGKWVKLTPSFDQGTAMRGGFLPMVEFDGVHDSVFPAYDINGKRFGEYVGDRGVHADLPLDEIDKIFQEKYEMYRRFLNGSVKLNDNGKLI